MPRSLNKVMIIGNCADEPVVRNGVGGGFKVANITIATNERRVSDDGNGYVDQTEWHRIVLWNRLADLAESYIHKGTKVYIEGKLRTRSYQDRNDPAIKRYSTEIVADNLILLDSRPTPNINYSAQAGFPSSNQGGYQQRTNNGNWGNNSSWQNNNRRSGNSQGGYGSYQNNSNSQGGYSSFNNRQNDFQGGRSTNDFSYGGSQDADEQMNPFDPSHSGFDSSANSTEGFGVPSTSAAKEPSFNNFAAPTVPEKKTGEASSTKEPNPSVDDDIPF